MYFELDGHKFYSGSIGTDVIHSHLGKNPKVIFDVGCFDCGDSIIFKRNFPDAEVYSFEANPTIYNKIKPLEKHGINIFNYAVFKKVGEVEYYECIRPEYNGTQVTTSSAPAGSLLKATKKAENQFTHLKYSKKPISVPCITIERFCNENNITEIDVLHMDVEGVVKEIISGFGDIRPKLINVEIDGVTDFFQNASTFSEVNDMLLCIGYKLITHGNPDSVFKYVG